MDHMEEHKFCDNMAINQQFNKNGEFPYRHKH